MDLRGVLVVEDVARDGAGGWSVPATEHVANRPIAHHVLDALEAAGVDRVVVASSERSAEAVRQCLATRDRRGQAQLEFVHQPSPLEFASALRLVAPIVDSSACIVHSAGGLLAEPLAPLAKCLNDGPDAVLMVHQGPSPDQRLSAATQSMLHLAELDPNRSALGMAGVWAFGPGGLRSAVDAHMTKPRLAVAAESASPVLAPIDVAALAERIAFAGGTLHVRLVDVWRAYRGEAAELLELNRLVLDGIETDLAHADDNGNRFEGRIRIHERASVSASVIVGPVVIGADARVRDAYIGPYTAIGAGAYIEGAEIERSIISAGASVTHIGGRITASLVGRNARLFRDFSLPRALRLRVGDGAEVGLC
jgi:glucose-1-phosphate thymidylyltransferase